MTDAARPIRDGAFSLALGGGGGRGWAHLGVARALDEAGLRPSLIVGTSMGAIVGAGLAAGFTPDAIEKVARRTPVYRLVGRRAHLALFDPRPVLERMAAAMGDPRIEELPIRLAITTYDLAAGRAAAITSGRLVDAVERSIAVPLFFPPCRDGNGGVWCDAGPWESVPVSVARRLSPNPVIGVWVDIPKPGFLTARPVAAVLLGAARRLASGAPHDRLTARSYLALLTERWTEPVVHEEADLMIHPRLGLTPAWQFSRIRQVAAIGYRDARLALAEAGLASSAPASAAQGKVTHAA
ncbi:MAG TPA: patatin-like phospholipase family protein [candidate division Zixibacteria bacterium]|nr:patatin-like phospholipase family protein [candidate division Zixibacteria bacterium]